MYFWNYKQLAYDLREGFVSDQNYLIYITIFIIQLALISVFGITSSSELYVTILFSIFWVGICYYINKAGDNKIFVKRLICLDLPIVVRVFVAQFACALVYHVAAEFYSPLKTQIPMLDNVVNWLGMLYVLFLYYISFRIASKQTD